MLLHSRRSIHAWRIFVPARVAAIRRENSEMLFWKSMYLVDRECCIDAGGCCPARSVPRPSSGPGCENTWSKRELLTENGRRERRKQPPALLPTAALTWQFLRAYFGYLNSGAAFSASFVVFIDASHLSFLASWRMLTEAGDTAT